MTWSQALRKELHLFVAILAGGLCLLGGMTLASMADHALIADQGQQLEQCTARHAIILVPDARHK